MQSICHTRGVPRSASPLLEVLALALKLGFTAFGGPAAHIAMLRDETVRRRAWLTDARFLDYLGITNLIPGPNSTEMVMHVSLSRAGWRGLILGGLGFILPASSITLLFAWLYRMYGTSPEFGGVLYGLKPVVIAIVVQAIWGLARPALKTPLLWGAALLAAAGYVAGINELVLLFGIAALTFAVSRGRLNTSTLEPIMLGAVLWSFLKIGATLYGSGYVLLAFLQNEFVTRGWLTREELLTAVAIGQVTPGPVFSSATFAGFLMAGVPGAVLATIGIFAPAFAFVAITHPWLERLRAIPWTARLLDALNAAALGLMVAVAAQLARDAITDALTVALALGSSAVLVRFKVNSTWLLLIGAVMGLASRGFELR
jgi:chromate transporter